ncbi:MAG: M20/M25/M40 family metallo-hydrolase [Arcobacteraceae bacterium]|jgi:dipeptidase D|nr:M20/M25/M40 family metallo-hydrolase [Arcobacteraceae bacterium]
MIINLFKEITNIPRCSGTHQPFIDFIVDFAKAHNYQCKVDEAKNILCYKKDVTTQICLQSHYDIVCLENGKIPTIIEKDGYLSALDSTLGADNGIGCAYMLSLMSEDAPCEFLFTSDEEIGLIGANNLQLPLVSKYMLNLDSEEEGRICIGCAGGVDIFGTYSDAKIVQNNTNKTLYEITIDALDGGHSGVDIDKNIPNAIKLVAKTIKECGGDLLDINGGERINSIPKKCTAIIASNSEPKIFHANISISKIDTPSQHYKKFESNVIDFLDNFSNGVREFDNQLHIPKTSINLSIIETTIDGLKISLSARSMDNDDLSTIKEETKKELEDFGFEVSTNGKYPAWKPQINEFSNKVLETYKKYNNNTSFEAVHAGLECAIFKEKYPHISITSIGPNIYFPHGNREKCEIASVNRVYQVLQEIIKTIN